MQTGTYLQAVSAGMVNPSTNMPEFAVSICGQLRENQPYGQESDMNQY